MTNRLRYQNKQLLLQVFPSCNHILTGHVCQFLLPFIQCVASYAMSKHTSCMMTQQRGEGQSPHVTHGLYHATNADVGGSEYADVGLHGESGMVSQVVMLMYKTLM